MTNPKLPIRSALILEDDGIISMMVEEMMKDLGASILHVCSKISTAMAAARETDLDCAILDIRVHNGSSVEVAEILAERGIPFIFSSGYNREDVDARFRDRPFLSKPFSDAELRNCLVQALEQVRARPLNVA